jgi:hypothetical protein
MVGFYLLDLEKGRGKTMIDISSRAIDGLALYLLQNPGRPVVIRTDAAGFTKIKSKGLAVEGQGLTNVMSHFAKKSVLEAMQIAPIPEKKKQGSRTAGGFLRKTGKKFVRGGKK